MAHVTFRTCSSSDEAAIADFLWSIKDDLHLSEKSAAAKITQLIFEKGGAIVGYHHDILVAMVGYFIGEPSCNYANREVGFIYVTGLAKSHRLSRAMLHGMDFTIRHLQKIGIKEIRCHAREQDRYTNRLYSHFAERLGKDVSLRGDPTILYGNTIDSVLAYLDKRQTRQGTDSQNHRQVSGAIHVTSSQTAEPQPTGALWYCSPCNVWWLSKAKSAPENWHLARMTEIDSLVQQKVKAPTWNVSGPSPLFCPECGKRMVAQTLPKEGSGQSCASAQGIKAIPKK